MANRIEIQTSFAANGSAVILLGIQGGVFTDPYKSQFEQLAQTYDVPYVPNVLSGIIGNKADKVGTVGTKANGRLVGPHRMPGPRISKP